MSAMRIEANDLAIELVMKDCEGKEIGCVAVSGIELVEHFIKQDLDGQATAEQGGTPGTTAQRTTSPVPPGQISPDVASFRDWLISKGMPESISIEHYGLLYVRTVSMIPTIQKKMAEGEPGRPS